MATATQEDYRVQLEVFEGPLDLLLYLIKKNEVDIYDIPIERITRQYMQYLDLMKMLDLNIAGEFIVMAATLMMIKSRMLLPVESRPELDEEDEGDDPRWDLVRQLVEYKKFKDAAEHLHELEFMRDSMFSLGGTTESIDPEPEGGMTIGEVSIFDLLAMFSEALKRARVEDFREIVATQFTVADKIASILLAVRAKPHTSFLELFPGDATRHEIVVTFLALLELMKLRQVQVVQEKHFGNIVVEAVNE